MEESDIFYHRAKKMAEGLISKERKLKIAANNELEKLIGKLQREFKASEEGVIEALAVALQSKSDSVHYRSRFKSTAQNARQPIRLLCRVVDNKKV